MSDSRPPEKTPEEEVKRRATYDTQTREQFETLGRYVQAFERLVDQLRTGLQSALRVNGLTDHRLAVILLNHHVMTAKPLFDAWRAVMSIQGELSESPNKEEVEESQILQALLAQTAKRFEDLVKTRNNLIHGFWLVGSGNEATEDWSEMTVYKLAITKSGFSIIDLPKTAAELKQLIQKIDIETDIIFRIGLITQRHHPAIGFSFKSQFEKRDAAWWSRFHDPTPS